MKRFWDQVSIRSYDPGHAILLDSRPVHLPGGDILYLGTVRLAEAVAAEWRAAGGGKGGEMSFADTPLTRLAGTAQERIAPDPHPTIDAIARYGESDLLCYRADGPSALIERQAAAWQPWLDWVERTHNAPLRVTSGVTHVRQHHDAISALRAAVAGLDPYALAALGIAVPALGSLVLGLAMAAGELDGETAHTLGVLDELFQEELWGEDRDAVERRATVRTDIMTAGRLIELTRENA